MYLNLYNYQFKANRYSYGSTYLKSRVTTNQKHTVDSQKPKRKELKHTTEENHPVTKKKRNKEEPQKQLENKV